MIYVYTLELDIVQLNSNFLFAAWNVLKYYLVGLGCLNIYKSSWYGMSAIVIKC